MKSSRNHHGLNAELQREQQVISLIRDRAGLVRQGGISEGIIYR
jgi:hypothetical protein